MDHDIIDEEVLISKQPKRRRKLLPIWVKIFVWLFMITGFIAPIAILLSLFEISVDLSLYGLNSKHAVDLPGITIVILFTLKGLSSFGLWFEKKHGVDLAIIDGIIGILFCTSLMIGNDFYEPYYSGGLRIEILFLIPYLIIMLKIRSSWQSLNKSNI